MFAKSIKHHNTTNYQKWITIHTKNFKPLRFLISLNLVQQRRLRDYLT